MHTLLKLGVGLAGVAYPLVMYATRGTLPASAFVAAGLLLIAGHLSTLEAAGRRMWIWPMAVAASALLVGGLWDAKLAAKSYPVIVSLAAASAFGQTLFVPPSFIERIARLQEPDLPVAGQRYCRQVTQVWTGWLLVNAVIAAALAVWGSDAAWALWTGVLSYLMMGVLFGGEIIVRRFVRRKAPA